MIAFSVEWRLEPVGLDQRLHHGESRLVIHANEKDLITEKSRGQRGAELLRAALKTDTVSQLRLQALPRSRVFWNPTSAMACADEVERSGRAGSQRGTNTSGRVRRHSCGAS